MNDNTAKTPLEIVTHANRLATELWDKTKTSVEERHRALLKMKEENPTLHALVIGARTTTKLSPPKITTSLRVLVTDPSVKNQVEYSTLLEANAPHLIQYEGDEQRMLEHFNSDWQKCHDMVRIQKSGEWNVDDIIERMGPLGWEITKLPFSVVHY